ncbi:MAG TPA: DUF507 family protein [Thermodesulfovibrionales bacterium]|jgi:hypothetical protein|nr:DUF507 family protein [Thermodesulfovibrionales bacterium]
MRFPKTWVPLLAKRIIDNILSKNLAKTTIPRQKLLAETEEILLNELTLEDRLNDEVREILKTHTAEIEKGQLDYRKLFDLTKHKLVRERNLVL